MPEPDELTLLRQCAEALVEADKRDKTAAGLAKQALAAQQHCPACGHLVERVFEDMEHVFVAKGAEHRIRIPRVPTIRCPCGEVAYDQDGLLVILNAEQEHLAREEE